MASEVYRVLDVIFHPVCESSLGITTHLEAKTGMNLALDFTFRACQVVDVPEMALHLSNPLRNV